MKKTEQNQQHLQLCDSYVLQGRMSRRMVLVWRQAVTLSAYLMYPLTSTL